MKHRVAGRKLGRTSAHRLALLRNLSTELFSKERIRTTLGKAKELRPFAEKLVTLSKRETLHARRQVLRHIHDRDVVAKLFDTLSARFSQRPGGYTRIIKLGPRRGDNAEMALIELVGSEVAPRAEKQAKGGEAVEPKTARRRAASGKAKTKKTARKEPAEAAEAPAEKPKRKAASPKPKKKAAPKAKSGAKAAGGTAGKGKPKAKTGGKPRKAGGS